MNGINSSYNNYITGYDSATSNKAYSGNLSQLQAKHKELSISAGIVTRKDALNGRLREEASKMKEFLEKDREKCEEAFNVSISDEAKQLYLQDKFDVLTPQQDVSFFKTPEKGAIQPTAKAEIPVKEMFREGTAEYFIFSALDGKVENAYELAKQLGGMIFSHDSGKDVEVRAIDRETGKKTAEYIANNYLDDPAEAQSFLDGIAKLAEKSEMRDKGYTVIIGSDIEPFKPKFNDLQQFAKEKFGYTDVDWSDTEKSSKIVKAYMTEVMNLAREEAKNNKNSKSSEESLTSLLNHDSAPYMHKDEKAAFNKAFDENEKKVQSMMDAVKNLISGTAADDSFFDKMNTVLSSLNTSQATKWTDIFSLLKN